jgi:hypothetical protein
VNPTFTDRGVASSGKTFRRSLVAVVTVLSVMVAGLGVWSVSQGPTLRDIVWDGSSLHKRAGGFITLRLDRAIEPVEAGQVRVSPDVPFSAESEGVILRVTFLEPLLANTEYQVEVVGLRPSGVGREASWSTRFQTSGFDFLFLRDAGDAIEVHRAQPGQRGSELLYRASGITSVVRVASVLAVIREGDGERWLELVDPISGLAERVVLPPGFDLIRLANATWGTTLVAVANLTGSGSAPVFGALILVDVLSDRTPEVVAGISGNPLSVRSVAVSAQSGEILVLQKNQDLVRFNPLTGVVLPVGSASELWGFDAVGRHVLYVDAQGTLAYNLTSGEQIRVPRGEFDGVAVRHQKFVLTPNGLRLHRVALPGVGDGDPYMIVTREEEEGIHRLVTGSLSIPGSVGNIALSPNGQYLLVEFHPHSTPLGYQGLSVQQIAGGTVIRVLDVQQNTLLDEFPGYGFLW